MSDIVVTIKKKVLDIGMFRKFDIFQLDDVIYLVDNLFDGHLECKARIEDGIIIKATLNVEDFIGKKYKDLGNVFGS
jgi:hypothetical protein